MLRHCLTAGLDVRGPLDSGVVCRALEHVVAGRPALRSVFAVDADYHDIVEGPMSVPVDHHLVPGEDPADRWERVHDLARAASMQPFPVGTIPLLRADIFTAADDRHLIVVYADQLVCDAWSVNLIVDDLIAAADTLARGGEPPLTVPDRYPAIRAARSRWLDGERGSRALRRRQQAMAGVARRWPWVGEPEPGAADEVRQLTVDVDDDATERLSEALRGTGHTMFAVGATALRAAAGILPDRSHAVGSTFAGRGSTVDDSVVGWLSNEVGIALPPADGTIAEYLAVLRGQVMAALDDQLIPAGLIWDTTADTDTGLSLSLMFLPGRLSGGADRAVRTIATARVARDAVDICPTGADVDLFMVEEPPPGADGARPLLRLGAVSRPSITGDVQIRRLLLGWRAALQTMAESDWTSAAVSGIGTLHGSPVEQWGERETWSC